jgi:hypothetical protein
MDTYKRIQAITALAARRRVYQITIWLRKRSIHKLSSLSAQTRFELNTKFHFHKTDVPKMPHTCMYVCMYVSPKWPDFAICTSMEGDFSYTGHIRDIYIHTHTHRNETHARHFASRVWTYSRTYTHTHIHTCGVAHARRRCCQQSVCLSLSRLPYLSLGHQALVQTSVLATYKFAYAHVSRHAYTCQTLVLIKNSKTVCFEVEPSKQSNEEP